LIRPPRIALWLVALGIAVWACPSDARPRSTMRRLGEGVATPSEWHDVSPSARVWVKLDGWQESTRLLLLPERPADDPANHDVAVGLRVAGAYLPLSAEPFVTAKGTNTTGTFVLVPREPLPFGAEVEVVTASSKVAFWSSGGATLARFRTRQADATDRRAWDGALSFDLQRRPADGSVRKEGSHGYSEPIPYDELMGKPGAFTPHAFQVWDDPSPWWLSVVIPPKPPDRWIFVSGQTMTVSLASGAKSDRVRIRLRAVDYGGALGAVAYVGGTIGNPTLTRPPRAAWLILVVSAAGALLLFAGLRWRRRTSRS